MNFARLKPRRSPDVEIGGHEDPYLRRWWVIPRNKFFNIYLHEVLRDDDDRALHDHPWLNMSIVLSGGYVEVCLDRGYLVRKWRPAGSVVFRSAKFAHRLELPRPEHGGPARPCWSLFITGPKTRTWGFRCPKGWVNWRVFTDADGTRVGKGCEQ